MRSRRGLSRKGWSPAKGCPVLTPFEVSGWGWSTGHLKGPIYGAGTLRTRSWGQGTAGRADAPWAQGQVWPWGWQAAVGPQACVAAPRGVLLGGSPALSRGACAEHSQEQADRTSHLESGLVESTQTEGLTLTSHSSVSPRRDMILGPLCSSKDVSVQRGGHEARLG